MAIDYDTLTTKQKQTYDFWVTVAKKPINDELEELLGHVAKPKPRVRKEIHEDKEKVSREAEAVLLHLRRVDTLMQKDCLECHRTFATNYHFAGRCSDDCIKASLARVGIEWNPEKSAQERWNGPGVNGEIPAIITPETLAFLKSWAVTILSWDEPKNGHSSIADSFSKLLGVPKDTEISWQEPLPMNNVTKAIAIQEYQESGVITEARLIDEWDDI